MIILTKYLVIKRTLHSSGLNLFYFVEPTLLSPYLVPRVSLSWASYVHLFFGLWFVRQWQTGSLIINYFTVGILMLPILRCICCDIVFSVYVLPLKLKMLL